MAPAPVRATFLRWFWIAAGGADKFTAGSGTDTATDHTLSQGDTLAVRARPEYYAAFL